MAFSLKSLATRAISGLIYIALIIGALLIPCGYPLLILFGIMATAMLVEFNLLTKINRLYPFRVTLDILASLWLLLATYLFYSYPTDYSITLFIPYFCFIMYSIGRTIFTDFGKALLSIGNALFAQLYIVLPLAIAISLSFSGKGDFNGAFVLLIFTLLWINDTGAYLFGCSFGKHKLYKKVSPKKSVEGLIAGILLSIIAMVCIQQFIPMTIFNVSFDLYTAIGFGFIISAMGNLGDLFESILKREADVKDSGNLIPGHGGILDRLDSFLFAIPTAAIVYLLMR